MTRKAGRSVTKQAEAKAIENTDRSFFYWLLGSLVTATAISGAMAMWSAMTNASGLG